MKRILLAVLVLYLAFVVMEQNQTIDDLSRAPQPGPSPVCHCEAP